MALQNGLDIDLRVDMHALNKQYAGYEKQVAKAINRATKKTITWLKRQMLREVSKTSGVPQKNLKQRVRSSLYPKEQMGIVWLGLNPIGAHKVGKARQTRKGVRIGRKHYFESAFYKKVFGNVEKVWRRKFRGPGSSSRGKKDGRFPVEVMLVDLEKIGQDAAERMNKEARVRYLKTLKQELHFAINVQGPR